MHWLVEVKRLRCAYLRARAALHRIAQSGVEERVALASKRALVTMAPTPEDTNLDEVWTIDCTPEHGSVIPKFSGQLWVQYREDGGADLEMIAECAPRSGVLVQSFDAVVGRLLASKTCRHLLQELAERIERQSAAT